MCRLLHVSRSGYYGWLTRRPSNQAKRRADMAIAVETSFASSRGIYGYRKVHEDLVQEHNMQVCRETVRMIMRDKGLASRVRRKYVVTTDSRHRYPVHANELNRDFQASGPNTRWVADITYIRTAQGWLYLAAVMDLYSRMIVGWAFSQHIDSHLVCEALNTAILQRRPPRKLLHHSDRGVQYASRDFQRMLDHYGIVCSMSRKGDCWDNACMESFFGKLKNEHIRSRIYRSRDHARQDIFWYMELFYNRKRRHAALGYVSPMEYERHAQTNQTA